MLPVVRETTQAPTIYFFVPDYQKPAGGIRVIYRHVDILNAAGIPAFALHQRAGFRCNWFDHDTKVTDANSARIRHGDLLVVPEVDLDLLARIPKGIAHVIFNQNAHLTWQRATSQDLRPRLSSPDLLGMLTVSDHNQELLRYAFPTCPVERVHLGIDAQLFRPGSDDRARCLSYMPRRSGEEARQVLEVLRSRNSLHGWQVLSLDGLSHEAVADQLRTTKLFLAFTRQEGFGLPAAEAMACGNYVIGHPGFGGREFFRPEFSATIESGDLLAFARSVEDAIGKEAAEPGWCSQMGKRASSFVLETYSLEREKRDVTTFYSRAMASTAALLAA